MPLPDDLPLDLACLLACGVITGVGAVLNTARMRPGASVAVIGAGGVGLNAIQGAALGGAARIIAVDLGAEKLAAAREFGATDGVLAGPEAAAEIRALTGGRGVDHAFVTVGASRPLEAAPALLAAGAASWSSACPPPACASPYDPTTLAAMNQSILGSRMGQAVPARDIPWLIAQWRARPAQARRTRLRSLSAERDQRGHRRDEIRCGSAQRDRLRAHGRKYAGSATAPRPRTYLVDSRPESSSPRRLSAGRRYFIFVKLTTDDGITGWGEVYAATVGPEAMRAVIADVFARHMEGESPENVELMFRRAYSAGFTQRPDPTVMGAFSGLEIACWDILGKARNRPVQALWGGRMRDRLRAYTYLYPEPGDDSARPSRTTPDASAACAARRVAEGWTAVKFDPAGPYTIHGGHQPAIPDLDRSVAFCRQIRDAVGDRADLLFGTHGQFTPAAPSASAGASRPTMPLWFEEPMPPDDPAATSPRSPRRRPCPWRPASG